MRRRQDWPSKWTINQEWPFRVAVRAEQIKGSGYSRMEAFCEGRSVCKRTFGYYDTEECEHRLVYCFANEGDAQEFTAEFAGKMLPPRTIPRWSGKPRRCKGTW